MYLNVSKINKAMEQNSSISIPTSTSTTGETTTEKASGVVVPLSSSSTATTSIDERMIPEGWVKCYSNKQKKDYYFNQVTGKSVWKLEDINIIVTSPTMQSSLSSTGIVKSSNSLSSPSTTTATTLNTSNDQYNNNDNSSAIKRRRVPSSSSTSIGANINSSSSVGIKDINLPITTNAINASSTAATSIVTFSNSIDNTLSKEELERKMDLEKFRESAFSRISAFAKHGQEKKLIFEPCNSERRYLM